MTSHSDPLTQTRRFNPWPMIAVGLYLASLFGGGCYIIWWVWKHG